MIHVGVFNRLEAWSLPIVEDPDPNHPPDTPKIHSRPTTLRSEEPVKRRVPAQEHAVLRAHYTSEREPTTNSKGRTTYRTRGERLVLENVGTVTATSVRVELRGLSEDSTPPELLRRQEVFPTLIPNSEFSWPLLMAMGMSRDFEVVMTGNEGEVERTETQHVAA